MTSFFIFYLQLTTNQLQSRLFFICKCSINVQICSLLKLFIHSIMLLVILCFSLTFLRVHLLYYSVCSSNSYSLTKFSNLFVKITLMELNCQFMVDLWGYITIILFCCELSSLFMCIFVCLLPNNMSLSVCLFYQLLFVLGPCLNRKANPEDGTKTRI